MSFELKRAKRTVQKARIAISGPSGSGKTYSALLLARGLVSAEFPERVQSDVPDDQIGIVVLDTEQRSSELYDHVAPFAPYHLEKPYTTERYIVALDEIERAKPLVIIVDQISHAWAGSGGLLEQVDKAKQGARNEFAAWGSITPKHTKFLERLLECRCHLIVTMRSKTEYVLEERTNRNGNKIQVPKKVGMAPVQRDGIEYEFMSTFELDRDTKEATVGKTRTPVFPEGETMKLDEAWGQKLYAWLVSAPAPEIPTPELPEPKKESPKPATNQRGKTAEALLQGIGALFAEAGLGGKDPKVMEEKLGMLRKIFGTSNWPEICEQSVDNLKVGKSMLESILVQRTMPGDDSVPFGDEK